MVCNCCGKEIEERKQDYIYIEKEWNYFSAKDGVKVNCVYASPALMNGQNSL